MKVNPKPVRVFTRDGECTKVDLYNCFVQQGRYCSRPVVEARGEIGINAIKYLKKKGYALEHELEGVDCWTLTKDGREWLDKGLRRHLELHPEDQGKVRWMHEAAGEPKPPRRRGRTTKPVR